MSDPLPRIEVASDHALRVCFLESFMGGDRSAGLSDAIEARPSLSTLAGTIRQTLLALRRDPLAGMTDVVAGYASILVRFDPLHFAPEKLAEALRHILHSASAASFPPPSHIELPVWYGGDQGPDLEDLARHAGLAPADVIARHAAADYTVAFFGFAPGFPYLIGLPPSLQMPRLASPRLAVPAGSVALAGAQAGIYPSCSPGGWRLIGRTSTPLLHMAATPWTVLQPGDTVRFVPQTYTPFVEPEQTTAPAEQSRAQAALHVLSPGPLTTVQDLGRPGFAHLGISAGGAADPIALRLANRLVGNQDGAAALEVTVRGPALRAARDVRIAVAGTLPMTLDGVAVPCGQTLPVRRGQILRCGHVAEGARAYLALAGGFVVPRLAGSAATDVRAGFGGFLGRALQSGDVLCGPVDVDLDPATSARIARLTPQGAHLLERRTTLRVTWGPQAAWFPSSLRDRITQVPLSVRAQANRAGLRLLADPPLPFVDGASPAAQLLSAGVSTGTVQVPPDGQPILLGIEQQVTGGYPVLAVVIAADLPLLGRLRPGDTIGLVPVSLADAQAAYAALQAALAQAIVSAPDSDDAQRP
ncbi:MAG: 5-oxoprolinase subunit PxpB [Myxococcales bacterium]|nr:5-oxoprolinase subunit PxpB [Myxococcales bacterium]